MVIATQSCTKEDVDLKNDNSNKEFLSIGGDSIILTIIQFMEQLENPSTASPMYIEDVVWSIEATLNYKYGNIEKAYYENYTKGESKLAYTLNEDDFMEFSQVKELYDTFKEELSLVYANIDSENKWLLLVDIESDNENNLNMFHAFGNTEITLTKQVPPWEEWYYGENLGLCNGGGQPSDAANEIDMELRTDFIVNHPQISQFRWIATSVSYPGPIIPGGFMSPVNIINTNDIIPQDNQLDYIIFHGLSLWPNYHTCLSNSEMDFYYNGSVHIISTLEGNYPNLEVVHSKLSDTKVMAGNGWNIFHGLDVHFGSWTKVLDDNSYTL